MKDSFNRKFELGIVGVVALVALRVGIGWHFFYEGMWKYKHPEEASAVGYFTNAKGPFGDTYRSMVPDLEGRFRLDRAWFNSHLASMRDQAEQLYNFSDDQKKRSKIMLAIRQRQAGIVYNDNKQEIGFYLKDIDALNAQAQTPEAKQMPFEQQRVWKKRTELLGKAKPWLEQIDEAEEGFRSDIASLLETRGNDNEEIAIFKASQRALGPLPKETTTLDLIDSTTCWLVMLVGFCLMVGLFTRVAAVAGAAFLVLVVAAMPALPNIYPPPHPSAGHAMFINKEVLEMIGLLVLAATPVGRWGGLDFFIHHLLIRPFYGTKVVAS